MLHDPAHQMLAALIITALQDLDAPRLQLSAPLPPRDALAVCNELRAALLRVGGCGESACWRCWRWGLRRRPRLHLLV
jgi:hypothetical protein